MRQLILLSLISLLHCELSAADTIGGVLEQAGTPGDITRQTGEQLTASVDTGVVSMDTVKTENGRLKIQFVDDTQVAMTEHTVIEINEYVYDPNPSKSKMALNFAQGTARFATGKLGLVPKENIAIQTPTANIGIRGTDFTTTVDELGRSLVILLPDEDCTDRVKLEQGCAPSGSITVTNDGGTVILEEAYQAVMVSTFETSPTQPVVLTDLNINLIDNMFIVSKPTQVVEAEEEQQEARSGADYLAFNDLDIDFLEENFLPDDNLEFSELDIDTLGVNFLVDLLDFLDVEDDPLDADSLAVRTGPDKITGTLNPGFDPATNYNTIIDGSGIIWFLRTIDGQGTISVKIPIGSNAKIQTESELTPSTICVNDCSGINIFIRQTQGG